LTAVAQTEPVLWNEFAISLPLDVAEVLTTVAAPTLPSDERICLSVIACISQTEE
jgi:hypothetical protein